MKIAIEIAYTSGDMSFKAGDAVAIIGIFVAFVSFLFAIFQYMKTQSWKKEEYCANEFEKMFESISWDAFLMLDNPRVKREMLSDESQGLTKIDDITQYMAARALIHHKHAIGNDSDQDIMIRNCFDDLIYRAGRFHTLIKLRLINKNSFDNHLAYLFELLNDDQDEKHLKRNLMIYIDDYHLVNAQKLLAPHIKDTTPVEILKEFLNNEIYRGDWNRDTD